MKAILASLEEVAEPFRTEYEAKNEKFYLKLEGGFVPSDELAKFRDKNIVQSKKLETLEGIDAKYTLLLDENKTLKHKLEGGVTDAAKKNHELIEAALRPVLAKVGDLEASLAKSEKEGSDRAVALIRKDLENRLVTVAQKIGVDPNALDDFKRRGLDVFQVEDGTIVAKAGEMSLFSKQNPSQALGVDEWAGGIQATAPHLFKPSVGGGASGSQSNVSGITGKPNATVLRDPTPQDLGRFASGISDGSIVVVHTPGQ